MHTIKLEHDDDTALDPADPDLVKRGTLLIDDHDAGWWEARRDGTWKAHVRHSKRDVIEASEAQLIDRLERDA